jgi:hypothetical protein
VLIMPQVPHLIAPIREGGMKELTELFRIHRREVCEELRLDWSFSNSIVVLGYLPYLRFLLSGPLFDPLL